MPCRPRPRLFIWCHRHAVWYRQRAGRGGDDHLCLPPIIRLTILGINQVPADLMKPRAHSVPARARCCSKFSYPGDADHYGGR